MQDPPVDRTPAQGVASAVTGSIAGRLLRIIFGCYFVVTLVVTTAASLYKTRVVDRRSDSVPAERD